MSRTVIIVGSIGVQFLLALGRYIPGVSQWFANLSPSAALGAQISAIGIHFTLLTASLALLFFKESTDRSQFESSLLAKIDGASIRPLRADEFYADFAAKMRAASHNVNICYFAVSAPNATHDKTRRKYYESIPEIIRSKREVMFRRLIRKSDSNLRWLATQVDELKGVSNVSLAVIEDAPESARMGLALSAQVIDQEHLWLVAIESHEREAKHRDIYVQDKKLADAFDRYFNRLWAQAVVVLEWGEISAAGRALRDSVQSGADSRSEKPAPTAER